MKQILYQIPQEDNLFVHNYDKFINKNWDGKYFYSNSIENPHIVPTLSVKWENLLQIAIDDETISKVLENIKVITLSTKLRSFLYRLIHLAIPTNTKLYEWKIVDSELCTFCNTEPETYVHLFWECQVAKQIWNQIEMWCKNKAKGSSNNSYGFHNSNNVRIDYDPPTHPPGGATHQESVRPR